MGAEGRLASGEALTTRARLGAGPRRTSSSCRRGAWSNRPVDARLPARAGRPRARRGRRPVVVGRADRRAAARPAARGQSSRAGRAPSRRPLARDRPGVGPPAAARDAARTAASTCSRGRAAGGSRPATSSIRSRPRSPGSSARSGRAPRSRSAPRAAAIRGSSPSAGRRAAVSSLATDRTAGCAPGGLDVGLAGSILVVGRAGRRRGADPGPGDGRPRGIVVPGSPGKERRDFLASEARQRAALHRLPPFAVLVLDGATGGRSPGRSWRSSRALAGARSRSWPTRRRSCSTRPTSSCRRRRPTSSGSGPAP